MSTLINRIQRAFLGSAGPEKVRALLAELQIPAGGSGGSIREVRRGVLRPISDEAILRDALAAMGVSGGGGNAAQGLSDIRNAVLHNVVDPETQLLAGLDDLLEPGDLAGGEEDNWVPENAMIHIDLMTGFNTDGRAWVRDSGEVAVNTLLGSDPNANDGYGGNTAWLGAELMQDNGYTGSVPAFIGDLLAAFVAGCTCRVQFCMASFSASNYTYLNITWIAPDGNDAIEMVLLPDNTDQRAYIDSWNGALMARIDDIVDVTAGAINVVAFTLSGTRAEISANGASPTSDTIEEIDKPAGNPLLAVLVDSQRHWLQSLTIYDPLPSTAGLSDLSASEGLAVGKPEWVPEGAYLHIDFVGGTPQGQAWAADLGEVAIDTLLGNSETADSGFVGHPSTDYDPDALVSEVGYLEGIDLAFIGAAAVKLLEGATTVVQMMNTAPKISEPISLMLLSGNGARRLFLSVLNNTSTPELASIVGASTFQSPDTTDGAVNAINKFAVTLTRTRGEAAINGSVPFTVSLDAVDWPNAGADAIAAARLRLNNVAAIQSITIYEPLPDTTGLPGLSEL